MRRIVKKEQKQNILLEEQLLLQISVKVSSEIEHMELWLKFYLGENIGFSETNRDLLKTDFINFN